MQISRQKPAASYVCKSLTIQQVRFSTVETAPSSTGNEEVLPTAFEGLHRPFSGRGVGSFHAQKCSSWAGMHPCCGLSSIVFQDHNQSSEHGEEKRPGFETFSLIQVRDH